MSDHSAPQHVAVKRLAERIAEGIVRHRPGGGDFNSWLAVKITDAVGTMWCAYAFAGLALISLPQAIAGGRATLVAWIAQTFLQLVLLSIIMVGQRVAAAASDRQAAQTYKDAEALLKVSADLHRLMVANTKLTEEIHAVTGAGKSSAP